jgi:hypothetical protein
MKNKQCVILHEGLTVVVKMAITANQILTVEWKNFPQLNLELLLRKNLKQCERIISICFSKTSTNLDKHSALLCVEQHTSKKFFG